MNGMELNAWKISEKIGEGACADVYGVVSPKSDCDKQFVIKIVRLPVKPKGRGLKQYKDEMRRADTLYSEYLIYQKLHGIDGIPYMPLRAYGESQGYRYLVIERLEKTLDDIFNEEGAISLKDVSRYGCQLIKILKALHAKNILYVDIKPENIMIASSKVYCVDFGITSQFMTIKGKHQEQTQMNQVVGTPRFASIGGHQGFSGSRRDDIESLLYVLIYLMKGSLPWDKATSDPEMVKIKKTTSVEELCKFLPTEWNDMLNEVRGYEFAERPNYDFLELQFKKMSN